MKRIVNVSLYIIFLNAFLCTSSFAQQQIDTLQVADTMSIDSGWISFDSTGFQYDTLAYIARDTISNFVASTDTTLNVLDSLNNTLQYLDMNKVPYGILFDKVIDLSSLGAYSDTTNDSLKPISNPLQFHQAYFEYYYAHIDTSQLINPDSIVNSIAVKYSSNIHPLSILKASFATIKPHAKDSGLLSYQNGHLYDAKDTLISAYDTNSVTLVSLGIDSLGLCPGTHQIVLDSFFIFGNSTLNIDTIQLCFSNDTNKKFFYINGVNKSQYQYISPITFNIDSTDSVIVVNAILTLANGSKISNKFSLINNAKLTSIASSGALTNLSGCNGADSFVITGYTPDASIFNDYNVYFEGHEYGPPVEPALGTYYVFYADKNCNSRKVTNPIIFIDGFDPSNTRRVMDIYNNYINKRVNVGGVFVNLADKMRADGYDLIILDYKNGADFIEKNGLLLAKTIEDIYSRYSSTIQNDFVVIGPSYGALVAQYGLAWMEKNGHPHHTRLYVSFDGPHHGANVPIGFQKFINYMDGVGLLNILLRKKFQALYDALTGPAARQMLDLHYFANSQSEPAPDFYRKMYLKHLNQVNIWPSALRKIAIINGNRDGYQNRLVNPGDKIAQFQHYTWWSFWTYKNIDWNIHASKPDESNRVMHNYSAGLGFLLLNTPWGWTNAYHVPGPNGAALDVCPGSYFGGLSGMDMKQAYISLGAVMGFTWDYYKANNTSFIPTVSSTATYSITPSYYNLYQNFANGIISSCANNTPFNWVYADDISTQHVQVDDNIGNWFINEIERKTQNLGNYTNNSYIHGVGNVCYNNIATYSLAIPAAGNIIWSTGSGLAIVGGQYTPNVIVISTNNSSAISSNISVTFTPTCADVPTNSTLTLNRNIYSGNPSLSLNFFPFGCDYLAYIAPPYFGATYEWSFNGGAWLSSEKLNLWPFPLIPGAGVSIPISVRTTHSCGIYTSSNNFGPTTPPISGCSYKPARQIDSSSTSNSIDDIVIRPNPTQSNWVFKNNDSTDVSMLLCDIQGKIFWKYHIQNAIGTSIIVPGTSLPPGVYVLKIISKDNTQYFKLIKE